jgi:hypothetical protein
MNHPEAPQGISEIIDLVEQSSVVDVWCQGCRIYRKMNAVYAGYVPAAGLQSCRFCREDEYNN